MRVSFPNGIEIFLQKETKFLKIAETPMYLPLLFGAFKIINLNFEFNEVA